MSNSCVACHRPLKNWRSRQAGIGPICKQKRDVEMDRQEELRANANSDELLDSILRSLAKSIREIKNLQSQLAPFINQISETELEYAIILHDLRQNISEFHGITKLDEPR